MHEFRDAEANILKKKADGFIMFIDIVYPFKKSHYHRDHEKAEKNQRKNGQIFSDDVTVQDVRKTKRKTRQVSGKLFSFFNRNAFFFFFQEKAKRKNGGFLY